MLLQVVVDITWMARKQKIRHTSTQQDVDRRHKLQDEINNKIADDRITKKKYKTDEEVRNTRAYIFII